MTLSYNISQISDVAKQLIAKVSSKTLCFYGEMGAGKTTLIKALVRELEGGGSTSSPTFGIVNEYHRENGELLGYHFDFYRLNDESEAWDLGLEEYLSGDTWVFMEWPEKIAGLLPPTRTEIRIEILDEKNRQLSVV
ncbi:tRNA (adenosine(37)-N6)-threonylcarbamoyltransferase complex ATPase subunit type 1 TsaE [Arenibacter sp. ARW7G5Y1]|uniref:tRNA (adenosine(37)-N6)-threonylcarbamoyltransferase complex ATPase subunit type 1 TsaE n=1 Tax=Arenibacter sp. ARW7G5Y1 TaxID=2135619 RepID=UPI000D753CCC|nr:tRNA (adenosine(37)-N6)-threonylcarbamoyltransferase complex ATPase subunit type 1 TsaE [Arenibacter sp. ARW7G5Y1]PXX29804.1 tRNA threonylcarbamoyladenosine biosynthesis protein TsaE [Arenibacter sp. ARW7G5Y1]|tara:strand:- start:20405 stop:20815 length:411 start_codon:yes stop_codon:yes gene_type:complete